MPILPNPLDMTVRSLTFDADPDAAASVPAKFDYEALVGFETVTEGALTVGTRTTFVSVTGTAAYTLAAGTYLGQRKRVECSVAASIPVGTLTLADAFGTEPTAWVFNAVGQAIELMWTSTGWKMMEIRAAGADTPAPASTLNLLVAYHILAIDGTDDWVIPSGVVPGQIQKCTVVTADNIPVGTISGLFYDEDTSADGVDIQLNAIADAVTLMWNGIRWVTIEQVSAAVA